MKKLNYLLMGLFVASAFTFTSCSSDDENATGPSMQISLSSDGGQNYDPVTTSEVAVEMGSVMKFKVDFIMGSEKLEKATITVKEGTGAESTKPIEIKNKEEFTYISDSKTMGSAIIVLTLSIEDKDGNKEAFTITINPLKGIKTSVAHLVGADKNATYGSFYSLSEDKVYKVTEAGTDSPKIDLVYFYGTTNKATLGAPSDSDTQTMFDGAIKNWKTKNATNLKKLSGVTFSTITNETKFNEAFLIGTSVKENNLVKGDIVAMQTSTGEKAIIEINDISAETNEGYITIYIKTVEK